MISAWDLLHVSRSENCVGRISCSHKNASRCRWSRRRWCPRRSGGRCARQTAGPIRLVHLFGIHPGTAVRYVHTAHPDRRCPGSAEPGSAVQPVCSPCPDRLSHGRVRAGWLPHDTTQREGWDFLMEMGPYFAARPGLQPGRRGQQGPHRHPFRVRHVLDGVAPPSYQEALPSYTYRRKTTRPGTLSDPHVPRSFEMRLFTAWPGQATESSGRSGTRRPAPSGQRLCQRAS